MNSFRIAQDALMTDRGKIPCDHCGKTGILHKWPINVKIKNTNETKKVTLFLCNSSWKRIKYNYLNGKSEELVKLIKDKQ